MKKHGFVEPLWKGFVALATITIACKLILWALVVLFSPIYELGLLIIKLLNTNSEWIEVILTVILTIVTLVPLLWLMGKIPFSNMFSNIVVFFFKKKAKARARKYLYSVKIKNPYFFGGYPIGLVTKEIIKGDKKYVNIVFPNIGGFITIPNVPEEDVELSDLSVVDTLLFYISCGSL